MQKALNADRSQTVGSVNSCYSDLNTYGSHMPPRPIVPPMYVISGPSGVFYAPTVSTLLLPVVPKDKKYD